MQNETILNPYQPPTAALEDSFSSESSAADCPFFPVSISKLIVLSICSFGLYQIYWFYQNWKRIKAREQSDISPFWRSFFAVFFCIQCFGKIRDYPIREIEIAELSTTPLAVGWIIVTLLSRLPEPYSLISLFAFAFFIPVQAYINEINQIVAPGHRLNNRYSVWNWVLVGIGSILLVLAVIGSFLPAS